MDLDYDVLDESMNWNPKGAYNFWENSNPEFETKSWEECLKKIQEFEKTNNDSVSTVLFNTQKNSCFWYVKRPNSSEVNFTYGKQYDHLYSWIPGKDCPQKVHSQIFSLTKTTETVDREGFI